MADCTNTENNEKMDSVIQYNNESSSKSIIMQECELVMHDYDSYTLVDNIKPSVDTNVNLVTNADLITNTNVIDVPNTDVIKSIQEVVYIDKIQNSHPNKKDKNGIYEYIENIQKIIQNNNIIVNTDACIKSDVNSENNAIIPNNSFASEAESDTESNAGSDTASIETNMYVEYFANEEKLCDSPDRVYYSDNKECNFDESNSDVSNNDVYIESDNDTEPINNTAPDDISDDDMMVEYFANTDKLIQSGNKNLQSTNERLQTFNNFNSTRCKKEENNDDLISDTDTDMMIECVVNREKILINREKIIINNNKSKQCNEIVEHHESCFSLIRKFLSFLW